MLDRFFFFSSRRRHTRLQGDWSSDVCSSDLPGGYGTQDETFEFLTLLQTGKNNPHPIVLVDLPGGTYWQRWEQFVRENMLAARLIAPEDLGLFRVVHSAEDAVAEIEGFYRNYHSSRFVKGRLALRLQR